MKKIIAFVLSVIMITTILPLTFAQESTVTVNDVLNAAGETREFTVEDWAVAESGDCAVSTNHEDDTTSFIEIIVEAKEGDIVAFDAKASCEYLYDGLCFSIDGSVYEYVTGNSDWETYFYSFDEDGEYLLTWEYEKDESDYDGDDCAYIKNIYVGENNAELQDIKVASSIILGVDGEKEIEVTPVPAYAELSEVTFASANENIAMVDDFGCVWGVEVGETTITVTAEKFVKEIQVKVVDSINAKAFLIFDYFEEYAPGLYNINLVTNELELIEYMEEYTGDSEISIYSAEMYNGSIYAYTENCEFLIIDAQTYELEESINVSGFATDMAYDYENHRMLGIVPEGDDSVVSEIVEIDLETGEFKLVETLDIFAMTFASNGGVNYVVEYETGCVYSYSTANGLQIVGKTGLCPAYIQTMAFDHNTDELYWLATTDEGETFNAVIGENGEASILCETGLMEYSGLMFDYEDPNPVSVVPVTGIKLDKESVSLKGGETVQLTATIEPEDATSKKVTWTSSNNMVAKVDKQGLVTAVGAGEAVITATTRDGKFTAECKVVVTDASAYLFYEDFEGNLEGWEFVDADNDGFGWMQVTDASNDGSGILSYEGTGVMVSMSYNNMFGPLTPDNYMISPAFKAEENATLSWYVCGQDPEYCNENYAVYVLANGSTNLNEAELVYEGVATPGWSNVTVDLSKYAGQEIRLVFRHFNTTDEYWINIDLITVSVPYTAQPQFMLGDANQDGIINTADAVTVLKFAAEMIELSETQMAIADVNADETVNTADAVTILRHVAGLEVIGGNTEE